jgi:cytosine/adenosine deaminase-related metal-dependent hydrolase
MRTRIRSRWLVAWDGAEQRWIPGGELVIEDDRVVYVGASYEGPVDRDVDASDALVAPGFVNVHVHAGPLAAGRAFDDHAGPDASRLGFLQYAAPREDAGVGTSRDTTAEARATVDDLLRGGVTTAVEIGGETGVPPEAMRDAGAEAGLRLVLGRGFRSRDYVKLPGGGVGYRPRSDDGRGALEAAIAFATRVRDLDDPWLGAMLFALQVDTCSPALLREAYAAADDLELPLQIHAAQTRFELDVLAREVGRTPVGQLLASGALGPRTMLAHGILLDHHPGARGPADRATDLDLLAAHGASVAHCPVAMARRGMLLASYGRYLQAGIPVAIGTDTYPRDLVAEMRWAVYLSRVADATPAAPTSWHGLTSVTSLAADRIGRPDLGRLAPGTRADFQIVDVGPPRIAHVHDPVAAWVHGGTAELVREVWTGGVRRRSWPRGTRVDGVAKASVGLEAGSEAARRRWLGD